MLQLLSHLCAQSTNGQLYLITIDAYQVSAGLSCPILKDNCPLPWMQLKWISCICQFLYSIHGRILLKEPWVPPPWCHNDQCIMNDVLAHISGINFEMFNSICLYLQVNMLSEIVDSNGKQICLEILDGTATPFPSTIQWPYQPNPTLEAWHVWSNTISLLYTKPSDPQSLKTSLGDWLPQTATKHCHWSWFVCPTTLTLYQRHHDGWLQYDPLLHWCQYVLYNSRLFQRVPQIPAITTSASP